MRSNSQDDISNTQQPIKSLFDDRVFITLLISGLVLSVASAAAIIYASNLKLCLQAECFNNALTVFKFPIGIATAGITLSGLYALAHRSQQTAIQIRKTEEQIAKAEAALQETKSNNIYSNYLRHKEACIADFKIIGDRCNFDVVDPEKLYSNIFPDNSPFSFSPRSTKTRQGYFLYNVHNKLLTLRQYLIDTDEQSDIGAIADTLNRLISEICRELRVHRKSAHQMQIDGRHVDIRCTSAIEVLTPLLAGLCTIAHIDSADAKNIYFPSDPKLIERLTQIEKWLNNNKDIFDGKEF